MTRWSSQNTKEKLQKHYDQYTPPIEAECKLFQNFREGHWAQVALEAHYYFFHDMVISDRRLKIHEDVSAVGISSQWELHILQ